MSSLWREGTGESEFVGVWVLKVEQSNPVNGLIKIYIKVYI